MSAFPVITVLGADALVHMHFEGGWTNPRRAVNVAISTLMSLERRKLLELEWIPRARRLHGHAGWARATLTDLGKAYAVVILTQREAEVARLRTLGTVTGRATSLKPNLQQLGRSHR